MLRTQDYDYTLPPNLIAKEPAVPRDHSRLFIYDTQKDSITFDHFFNLAKYLPQNSFLVLNETKVLPSRITLKRRPIEIATSPFGNLRGCQAPRNDMRPVGNVTVLFLVNEEMDDSRTMRVMVDRKVMTGDKLFFNEKDSIEVIAQDKQLFTVKVPFGKTRLFHLLEQKGSMPIPLYIKNSPLTRDELIKKYQTIFARAPDDARLYGSAAAPTASLHFTDDVFASLDAKQIERLFITLHVGLGTFAPVSAKNISEKKLHEEWFEIPSEVIEKVEDRRLKMDRKLVAVGTTVSRTLEAFANSKLKTLNPKQIRNLKHQTIMNKTDLFIYPPYKFKMVDHLITNFHLPGSSLMMLVEAFLQHKRAKRSLVDLYQVAIKEKFRFYSFGDGMLIL